MRELPHRPEVTLTRSSLPLSSPDRGERAGRAPRARRTGVLLLGAAGLAVALAVAVGGAGSGPAPELVAELVVTDGLTVTQGGVFVVPLELRNRGPELSVRAAKVYAEPVVTDPIVQAPTRVRAQGQRRFVALLEPDCRLLRPGSTIDFRATVQLRLVLGATSRDVVVDLAQAPSVREQVAGLCRVS